MRSILLRGIAFILLGATTAFAQQEEAAEAEADAPPPKAQPPAQTPEQRAEMLAFLREAYAKPAAEWPKPDLDPGRPFQEIGPLDWKPTGSKEQHRLGVSLFFDPRLSKSMGVSCSSCHEPQLGWSNGIAFSFGEHRQQITRHPPTLVGIGFQKSLFWDGREDSLEHQARDVIMHPVEMNGEPAEIVGRQEVEKEYYGPLFEKAFGDAAITFPRILEAIAVFERNIPAGRTKFDKFTRTGDVSVLSDSELSGLHLFRTKARCLNCHMGPTFSDGEFHNLGLTYYGRRLQDLGRYTQTKLPEDVGKFRTPTLRNVGRTAPYMHNGVFPILEGILRLYNAGMPRPRPKENQVGDPLFPKTSEHLKPLNLSTQELTELKDFLLTLNEPPVRVLSPPVPPILKEKPAAIPEKLEPE